MNLAKSYSSTFSMASLNRGEIFLRGFGRAQFLNRSPYQIPHGYWVCQELGY